MAQWVTYCEQVFGRKRKEYTTLSKDMKRSVQCQLEAHAGGFDQWLAALCDRAGALSKEKVLEAVQSARDSCGKNFVKLLTQMLGEEPECATERKPLASRSTNVAAAAPPPAKPTKRSQVSHEVWLANVHDMLRWFYHHHVSVRMYRGLRKTSARICDRLDQPQLIVPSEHDLFKRVKELKKLNFCDDEHIGYLKDIECAPPTDALANHLLQVRRPC